MAGASLEVVGPPLPGKFDAMGSRAPGEAMDGGWKGMGMDGKGGLHMGI